MNQKKIQKMTYIALFSTLAFIATLFEFPIPFFPPFLKIDISDIFIFISAFIVGPAGMITVIIIKSILHWLLRGSEIGVPIGQLTSIISSLSFCLPAYYLYQTKKYQLLPSLISGSLVMTTIMFIANFYVITPFYFMLADMPLPQPFFPYMLIYLPFNLVKSGLLSLLIIITLPHILPFLKKKGINNN
ncbi:MAG: ECF transporter S component [Culicoidibacterales bacterium]